MRNTPDTPPTRRRDLPTLTRGDWILLGLFLAWAFAAGWLVRVALALLDIH